MQPETSENVERFLTAYQRAGVYWLVPAVLEPGRKPDLLADLAIFKRAISIKSADEIGRNDIEIMALHGAEDEEVGEGPGAESQ